MTDPVNILIRTSGRPEGFKKMMESVKKQTYKNIRTIVHSDDPRDEYVAGDIIVKDTALGSNFGSAPYNLYNNRLLKKIPDEPGWIFFLDDDDEIIDTDGIERFIKASKKDHINVCQVLRWDGIIFPKGWGKDKSFQTECFLIHTDHRLRSKWPACLGGDHIFSEQLTKILPINWIENLILCRAMNGKGHGKRLDINNRRYKNKKLTTVNTLGLITNRKYKVRQNEYKIMRTEIAEELEQKGIVKITYQGNLKKQPVQQLFKI